MRERRRKWREQVRTDFGKVDDFEGMEERWNEGEKRKELRKKQ